MPRKNKTILKMMRNIYYGKIRALSPHLDFMGYEINQINYPTYHHIIKVEDLKRNNLDYGATIDNGAYLGCMSHIFLHDVIEKHDLELYDDWSSLFLDIVNRKSVFDEEIDERRLLLQKRGIELSNSLCIMNEEKVKKLVMKKNNIE